MSRTSRNGIPSLALRPIVVAAAAMLAASLFFFIGSATAPALAAGSCNKVAAPNGSDSAAGTETRPFETVQKLADSLSAGDTGCLRQGTFSGNLSVSTGGAPGAPLTITSYPGERATVEGKLWIKDSADFVTISSLNLNGSNPSRLPSPAVNGDDVTFADNDVTNEHTAICFNIGPTTLGRANRTLIERNRIHDCGVLPATNLQHGVYVEHSTDARIVDNTIYDNADRGVQLYPDAQRTYVARNTIDGNGEGVIIAGGAEEFGPQASNDNVIELNVITNSTQRYNVESFWGSAVVGERNVVRKNCIFGGARDGANHGLAAEKGFTATDNVHSDPLYVNRAAKDFRLSAGSPCADLPNAKATSSAAAGIVLSRPASALRPGSRITLKGRVTGGKLLRSVKIRTRAGKRWKTVVTARVKRNGTFSVKPRLRGRLSLGAVRLSRASRTVVLQATGAGLHSNSVNVRVGR